MWLAGIVVAVFGALLFIKVSTSKHADDAPLGRMSQEWLAEYQSTHSG